MTTMLRRAVPLCALVGLFYLTTASVAGNDFVPEEMVCKVTTTTYIDTINIAYGTTVVQHLPQIGAYLLKTAPGVDAEQLAGTIGAEPYVIYCDANYILDAPEPVQGSQPFIDFQQQGTYEGQSAATTLNVATAQDVSTGTGTRVAVIDVGVNPANPVLSTTTVTGFDYIDNDTIPYDELGGGASGHGTFVAGVVKLVAPDVEIGAYRVLDTAGRGNGFTVAEAIIQAIEDGSKVINLSMVMSGNHGAMDEAIEYARNNNVLVVCAAGNDSTEIDRFPARDSYTLSVAAVDSLNQIADFSSYGGKVDVCAPGTRIYSPYGDTTFAWWDGTSFAAPFVAGQAALLYAARPTATWDEIVDAITSTAQDLEPLNPGFDGMLGDGLIDPTSALAMLTALPCGDINGDGTGPNLTDVTMLVNYLFVTFEVPDGLSVADVNASGTVTLSDLTVLVNHLFVSGSVLNCGT